MAELLLLRRFTQNATTGNNCFADDDADVGTAVGIA
jgi:hypothetical protein